jgi:hypothetical protein
MPFDRSTRKVELITADLEYPKRFKQATIRFLRSNPTVFSVDPGYFCAIWFSSITKKAPTSSIRSMIFKSAVRLRNMYS